MKTYTMYFTDSIKKMPKFYKLKGILFDMNMHNVTIESFDNMITFEGLELKQVNRIKKHIKGLNLSMFYMGSGLQNNNCIYPIDKEEICRKYVDMLCDKFCEAKCDMDYSSATTASIKLNEFINAHTQLFNSIKNYKTNKAYIMEVEAFKSTCKFFNSPFDFDYPNNNDLFGLLEFKRMIYNM